MYDRINKYNENNKQLQEFNSSGASDSIKTSYSNMYIKNGFVEMITKSYIPYYLKHILDDMGYTITVSKQVKKVKLENCEKYDDKHKSQIMEDILAGKQLNQNDYKLICSIKKRIEALGVTKDYNKLQKKLIINPTRFEQHRRLRTFLTHDIDKLVGRYKAHCFDEDMLGNIGMKLKYYKLVTDFLGVKYNILFDYESNIKNINKKVDDNAFLKQLNEINKVFRIRTKKYNTIDNFNLLYQLAVKMHIQLFGKHLIDIRYKNIIYGGKKYKPPIYQTNKKRLLEHIRIFSLESIGQVNVQLLDELGYKYDPFIDREEEMRHILRKCRKNNMIALREDILLKLSHMDIIRKRNEHLDRINQQIDEQYEELIKNMEN